MERIDTLDTIIYDVCKNQARMVPWFRIGSMSVSEVLVTHVEDDLVKVEHYCYW